MDIQRENSTQNEREERIRERAHGLWEQDGRPEGREKEHWERAVTEVEGNPQNTLSSDQDGSSAGNIAGLP